MALHTARHALQPELRPREASAYLLLDGQLLALAPELVTVDVDEVEAAANAVLAEPTASVGRAERLASVLEQLEPELLPEDSYADWTMMRRAELTRLHTNAVHELALTWLATDQARQAARLLERHLVGNPADEQGHELLLRSHLALGRPEQAVRQYEVARLALHGELGVGPGAVLEQLHRAAVEECAGSAARPAGGSPHPALPAAIRAAERTPIFGRKEALRLITAADPGLPPLTLVAGEAGVGKTRLAAAAARAAHGRGAMVLWAAGHEAEGQTPYGLWADAFDAWFAARSSAEQAAAASGHDALATLVPALGPAPMRGVGPEEERARLFQAVSGLLKDLATASPAGILVVLDDVHAADLGSLQMLYHVVRRAGDQPWRFIATFREEELIADPGRRRILNAAIRQNLARRVDLMRLSEQDCDRLVRALCAERVDSDSLTSQVFRLSAGNPLFATELAGLVNSGLPLPSAAGLDSAGVPDSVRGAVEARLDLLGVDERAIIDVLAAAGGDVHLGEASQVARAGLHPPIDPPRFAAALNRLLTTGLVEEREVVSAGRTVTGYGFRHPVVRLACYAGLNGARRRVLHAAHADAVLGHRPDAVDTVAFHLALADDPRAVTWLRRAAEKAAALYANDSADRYYTELIGRLDATDEQAAVADARHDHALILRRLARYDQAEQALRSALEHRLRAGTADAAARSLAALAELVCQSGHPKDARTLLNGTTLPSGPLSAAAQVALHLASSVVDFPLGRYEQMLASAIKAESAAHAASGEGDGVPLLLGRALGNRSLALAMLDRTSEAHQVGHQALEHAERVADVGLLTTVLSMLSEFALRAGRYDEARVYRRRSLGLAERGATRRTSHSSEETSPASTWSPAILRRPTKAPSPLSRWCAPSATRGPWRTAWSTSPGSPSSAGTWMRQSRRCGRARALPRAAATSRRSNRSAASDASSTRHGRPTASTSGPGNRSVNRSVSAPPYGPGRITDATARSAMDVPGPPADHPPPVMVVDAGSEPWERVEPLLARRVEELPTGAVLELLSTEPAVRAAVHLWCAERGHALGAVVSDAAASVFCIQKNHLTSELT
ncbi:AAA family ATPase [Micromonospora sp. DR5-3]|nr:MULTISPECIES: AAA family ATPase [unclassified Micromonospora]MCW3817753.1 AAA family ATPase [Micromonospora sp. DR5-3]